ncbi:MAG: hypothetical protein OHK0039_02780 [Bacteroidia bacterium]
MTHYLIGLLGLLLLPAWVQACVCDPPATTALALERADYAFVGTCTYVESNWIAGGMKYSFRIEESWKKQQGSFVIVSSPFEQACGTTFEQGMRYLVFVEKKFAPKTYACRGNRVLSGSDIPDDMPATSMKPATSGLAATLRWVLAGLGGLAMIFVVFVVLRKRLFVPKP